MPKPKHHIFICAQRRPDGHPRGSCGAKGADGLYDAFARELIKRNLQNSIALTNTGCLGPCQGGANVLVYPEGIMYSWVEAEDAAKIVEEHLVGGTPWADKLTPAEIW